LGINEIFLKIYPFEYIMGWFKYFKLGAMATCGQVSNIKVVGLTKEKQKKKGLFIYERRIIL